MPAGGFRNTAEDNVAVFRVHHRPLLAWPWEWTSNPKEAIQKSGHLGVGVKSPTRRGAEAKGEQGWGMTGFESLIEQGRW